MAFKTVICVCKELSSRTTSWQIQGWSGVTAKSSPEVFLLNDALLSEAAVNHSKPSAGIKAGRSHALLRLVARHRYKLFSRDSQGRTINCIFLGFFFLPCLMQQRFILQNRPAEQCANEIRVTTAAIEVLTIEPARNCVISQQFKGGRGCKALLIVISSFCSHFCSTEERQKGFNESAA